MNVLGVWDGHDSGAALLQDGRLRFAVNEERLTRRKLEIRFPSLSIESCLARAGVTPAEIDVVAVSTSDPAKTLSRWWPGSKERYYDVRRRRARPGPFAELTRALKYRVTEWPSGPVCRALSRMALRRLLARHALSRADLRLIDHHEAHGAAAAWAAGGAPWAVLTIDGVGDGLSSTISIFRGGRLERIAASTARCSLGVFFEHVTAPPEHAGARRRGQGHGPGRLRRADPRRGQPAALVDPCARRRHRNRARGPQPQAGAGRIHWRYPNEQFAYLAQRAVENTCVALARDAVRLTGIDRLALAGGVVSNIRAARRIRLLPDVKDVYVFPHMGDGGLALGAAVAAAAAGGERIEADLTRLDLGHDYQVPALAAALQSAGFAANPMDRLASRVADMLAAGQIVMWFQGRMEYGPRALGHRSVLARPDRCRCEIG